MPRATACWQRPLSAVWSGASAGSTDPADTVAIGDSGAGQLLRRHGV